MSVCFYKRYKYVLLERIVWMLQDSEAAPDIDVPGAKHLMLSQCKSFRAQAILNCLATGYYSPRSPMFAFWGVVPLYNVADKCTWTST